MSRLLKMKHLSLVTLVVYLAWIFPVVQLCTASERADVSEQRTVHGLSQLTSATNPVKNYVLADENDNSITQLHCAVLVSAFYPSEQFLAFAVRAVPTAHFSARAPPYLLN